jgi:hypothetical protein
MFDLKPISKEAIPQALEKAHHYRLLNDPLAAESICLDVLDVDTGNQQALVTLILALADRLAGGYIMGAARARDLLPLIKDNYQRTYYNGIICERQANAVLAQGGPGSRFDAYEWLRDAMECYEEAEAIRPQGNDDSILRWNTCIRIIKNNNLEPRAVEVFEPYLE